MYKTNVTLKRNHKGTIFVAITQLKTKIDS